ncbi:hypothetical protein ACE6H2_007566 [Prunus campanulata]
MKASWRKFLCACQLDLWSASNASRSSGSLLFPTPNSVTGTPFKTQAPARWPPPFFLAAAKPSWASASSLSIMMVVHPRLLGRAGNLLTWSQMSMISGFFSPAMASSCFLKIIPPTASTTRATGLISYALAFDPSKSPHYKVFCLRSTDGTAFGSYYHDHHIEIYSSETRSWRLLDSTFHRQPVDYIMPVYCNGAIHWIGWDAQLSYYHMDEERVGWVDSRPFYEPYKRDEGEDTYFFETPGGHLHLARVYWRCQTQFDVLEMGRNYSGWFVKYNVDLVHDPPIPIPDCYNGKKELFFCFLLQISMKMEVEERNVHLSCCILLVRSSLIISSFELTSNPDSITVWGGECRYMETLACV